MVEAMIIFWAETLPPWFAECVANHHPAGLITWAKEQGGSSGESFHWRSTLQTPVTTQGVFWCGLSSSYSLTSVLNMIPLLQADPSYVQLTLPGTYQRTTIDEDLELGTDELLFHRILNLVASIASQGILRRSNESRCLGLCLESEVQDILTVAAIYVVTFQSVTVLDLTSIFRAT